MALSRLALFALSLATMPACLVTEPKEFPEEPNLPSSIRTPAAAMFPADEIIRIDQGGGPLPTDGGVVTPTEIFLSVEIRDPNLDQTLEARLFADNAASTPDPTDVGCPPGVDNVLLCVEVEPTVNRDLTRPVELGPISLRDLGLGDPDGRCVRLDLRVSEQFNTDRGTDDPNGAFFVSQLTWLMLIENGDPNVPVAECP